MPTPFGPVIASTRQRCTVDIEVALHGYAAAARDARPSTRPPRAAARRRAHGTRRRDAGHPDAAAASAAPGARAPRRARRRRASALRREHDHPVDEPRHTAHAVLDHDERRAGRVEHARHRIPHLDDPVGVEVRGRLVEQQHAGTHRERAREREALLLAARQRRVGAIERHVEPDRVERVAHARPDLVARDAEVLAAERDIVADARQHDLGVGILQHEPDAAPDAAAAPPVDRQRARALALVVAAEHSRERAQQRGLAGAGCAEQQHALPRLDREVEVAHRPGEASGVPPAPAARRDRGGCGGTAGARQTRPALRGPAANRFSAPVRASARTSSHDPSSPR